MEITKDSKFRHFEGTESIQMGLDLQNSHSIMSLLRNNIYSDTVKSFVREVFSNAIDAMTRAGNTRDSIQIAILEDEQLSRFNFSVRDFGDSMDKEKIKSVYAILGKSDKTSDNKEVGGWGIGAASPLAYTDHFYIETWTKEEGNHIYRKWVQYIDSTRVGAINLLNEIEAHEDIEFKTGTKVTVPVESNDRARVEQAINLYLYYTKVKFTLEGFSFSKPNNYWYNYIGSEWGLATGSSSTHTVLVGDIPYKVNLSAFYSYINNNSDLQYLLTGVDKHDLFKHFNIFLDNITDCSVLLKASIGEVDLSASREDMQYTDKTCRTLYSKYFAMYKEFSTLLIMDLIKNPSFGEACKIYSNYPSCFRKTKGLLEQLKWAKENRPFNIYQELSASTHYFTSFTLDKQYSRSNHTTDRVVLKKSDRSYIEMTNNYKFVCVKEDSKNTSKYIKFYMQRLQVPKSWTFIVVTPVEQGELYNWVIDSFEFLDLRELEAFYKKNYICMSNATGNRIQKQLCRTYQYRGTVVRDKADDIGKLFLASTADRNPESPQYYIVGEEYGKVVKNPVFSFNRFDYEEISKRLNEYLDSKGIDQKSVYYSKTSYNYYSKGNWINLLELIKEDVEIAKANEEKFFKAYFIKSFISSDYSWMLKDRLLKHVSKQGRFYSIVETFINASEYIAKHSFIENLFLLTQVPYRNLLSKTQVSYSSFDSESLSELDLLDSKFAKSFLLDVENFIEDYPMLKSAKDLFYTCTAKEVADYINLVEKSTKDYAGIKNALVKETAPYFTSVLAYLESINQELKEE